jgi:hypothetical protein
MFVLKTLIIYELQLKRYQIKEHIFIAISIMAYKLIFLPDDDASFLLNHPGVGYYNARSLLQQFLGRHVDASIVTRYPDTVTHIPPDTVTHRPPDTVTHRPPDTVTHRPPDTVTHRPPDTVTHRPPDTVTHRPPFVSLNAAFLSTKQ